MKLATVIEEIRKRATRRLRTEADDVEIFLKKRKGRWVADTMSIMNYGEGIEFRASRKQTVEDALLGLLAMLREKPPS
jgi:hypothetical protein